MNREQLRKIFIEEANEIIERLDSAILNFEEDPTNKEILNELFRGVHTLKGSANSFGFTKLGKFVHSFEDALDYYRNSLDVANEKTIDLFLEAVDLIKNILNHEIEGKEGEPPKYHETLDEIKKIVDKKAAQDESQQCSDLAVEFGEDDKNIELQEGENRYTITLKADSDIYFRGYDHATFFKILSQSGRIVESRWDLRDVPTIDNFDAIKCEIGDVTLEFISKESLDQIKGIFEFLEDSEYQIVQKESLKLDVDRVETVDIKSALQIVRESENILEQKQDTPTIKPIEREHKKQLEARSFVRIDTVKLDELFDSVGELVIAQNFLSENELIKNLQDEGLQKTIETLSKITRRIQKRVMSLRMVPIKNTFEKMRRVVRDASKKVEKEIKLVIIGEDTEIDKTMIDQISDPLIHLIRNSIDHGIEASAEDRKKSGKPEEGVVTLRAYHKGGNIAIEVCDDGRGISRDAVLKKAIERGVAKEGEELTDAQVFNFILQPSFSTAEKISDVSGRGVGLDVVRSFIESMRGKIEIDSVEGEGSTFRILLPLTLAIIDGMLVKSAGETFIIPTLSVIESFRPDKEIVHTAQGKGEFVNLRNEILPVVRLNHVMNLNSDQSPIEESILVCAENERGKFAILVDELIGRQQVVIKPLGKVLSRLKEISGGAVMGNGEVALIINVEGLY